MSASSSSSKESLLDHERERRPFLSGGLELVGAEAAVVVTHLVAVHLCPILEVIEVVAKFVLELLPVQGFSIPESAQYSLYMA